MAKRQTTKCAIQAQQQQRIPHFSRALHRVTSSTTFGSGLRGVRSWTVCYVILLKCRRGIDLTLAGPITRGGRIVIDRSWMPFVEKYSKYSGRWHNNGIPVWCQIWRRTAKAAISFSSAKSRLMTTRPPLIHKSSTRKFRIVQGLVFA